MNVTCLGTASENSVFVDLGWPVGCIVPTLRIIFVT
jgi:hypothetical protein